MRQAKRKKLATYDGIRSAVSDSVGAMISSIRFCVDYSVESTSLMSSKRSKSSSSLSSAACTWAAN